MLNTWIKQTRKFFQAVEAELLAIKKAELDVALAKIGEPTLFNICKLVLGIYNGILNRHDIFSAKLSDLGTSLKQNFGKSDVSGFFVELKSHCFRLLRTVESLGRLNLENQYREISRSYETLLVRLQCELLFPKFTKRLYDRYLPGQQLLSSHFQILETQAEIRSYFRTYPFASFKKVMLDFNDLSALIGESSVRSLFSKDDVFCHKLMQFIQEKHPVLKKLSENTTLPPQNSPQQLLEYLEIFGVLSSYPYSVETLAEHEGASTKTLAPNTSAFLANLNHAQFELLKEIYALTQELLRRLQLQFLSTVYDFPLRKNVANYCVGNTFWEIYHVVFTALLHPQSTDEIKQEFEDEFSRSIMKFRCVFTPVPAKKPLRFFDPEPIRTPDYEAISAHLAEIVELKIRRLQEAELALPLAENHHR